MVTAVDKALDEAMSAVMDGSASPADWALVSAAWDGDVGLRERWAAWHAAADGLRSADLPALHREPEVLLARLHQNLPAADPRPPVRRDWFAPLAVAASFVAVALVIGALRPQPATGDVVAVAPLTAPRAQGLSGQSFAQTAAGRTLAGDTLSESIDWGLALPEPSASEPHP